MEKSKSTMNLFDLPDCMLEQILECLSYDEIAKQRIVCKKFNTVCQGLLNLGFHKIVKRHGNLIKFIKSQLPRRESERKNHPLANHSDILTCIETRISLLSMSYTKYIEVNLCCFIPGKVIDEIIHLLRTITNSSQFKRLAVKSSEKSSSPQVDKARSERKLETLQMLQELRDISSMAIEHFDEKIAPSLKKALAELPTRPFLSCMPTTQPSPDSFSLLFADSQQNSSASSTPQKSFTVARPVDPHQSNYVRMERKFKAAMRKLNNVIGIQNRQAQKLRNCSMQINELNAQVIDLRRRLKESNNSKNSLEQISNAVSGRTTRASSSLLPSNRIIKPRTASIILKRIADQPTANDDQPSIKKAKY